MSNDSGDINVNIKNNKSIGLLNSIKVVIYKVAPSSVKKIIIYFIVLLLLSLGFLFSNQSIRHSSLLKLCQIQLDLGIVKFNFGLLSQCNSQSDKLDNGSNNNS